MPRSTHPTSNAAKTPASVVKRVRHKSPKPPQAQAPAESLSGPPLPETTASAVADHAESGYDSDHADSTTSSDSAVIGDTPSGEPASKRKRKRRRKGKGGVLPMPNTGEASGETDANFPVAEFGTETSTEELRNPTTPPRPNTPRASCDPVAASKMAWKLYQGEIGEEGIALIDDQDARDLARRCFRLAEIFLDEQARRAR